MLIFGSSQPHRWHVGKNGRFSIINYRYAFTKYKSVAVLFRVSWRVSFSILFVNLPCGLSDSQNREMVPRLCHVKDKYLIGMCHLNMSTMNCVSGFKSCKAENGGRKEKFLEYFQMMKQTMWYQIVPEISEIVRKQTCYVHILKLFENGCNWNKRREQDLKVKACRLECQVNCWELLKLM